MGMCSNIKKSPKSELDNSVRQIEKNNIEKKEEIKKDLDSEEFKDMEEWEGIKLYKNF